MPLADGAFRLGALTAENLATRPKTGRGPAVQVKDPGPARRAGDRHAVELRVPERRSAAQSRVGPGGSIAVSFSDNHGLDWTDVARIDQSGEHTLDLKKHCYRRYDYRLKFDLPDGHRPRRACGSRHDIQHSQAPLPALLEGDNTITFTAGPHEGTVTSKGPPAWSSATRAATCSTRRSTRS